MEHYRAQAAHHFEMYSRALDCDNKEAAKKHMQEYENYQELLSRVN